MSMLRSFPAARRGNITVELALALPVLIALASFLVDLGISLKHRMTLENGARAGVEYAIKDPTDSAAITAAALGASGLDPATTQVGVTLFCECADGRTITCSNVCTDGLGTRRFVTVTLQQPYAPILPFADAFIPSTLSGASTFRLQ